MAYKSKVTELADKGLGEEELSKELELLKVSHHILILEFYLFYNKVS